MPEELWVRLEQAAATSGLSVNAEIVKRLEASLDPAVPLPKDVRDVLADELRAISKRLLTAAETVGWAGEDRPAPSYPGRTRRRKRSIDS